jgi:hypothetical protein
MCVCMYRALVDKRRAVFGRKQSAVADIRLSHYRISYKNGKLEIGDDDDDVL